MKNNKIMNWVRAFRDDARGSVSVEFALIMPFLFWAFGASYVYFDGYRQSSVNLKAAFTIGDMISRETDPLNDAYMDSMYNLLNLMTRTPSDTTLRVTVVRWDEDDDRYYFDWSQTRGAVLPMTDADVIQMADKLPVMPDNERVILVETSNSFVPLFNIGMDTLSLDNFVFTRPRFAPQVLWES